MRKLLLISFLMSWISVTAQDERRFVNGKEYPIWYSKTRVLVKFKEASRTFSIPPSLLGKGATKIVEIPSIPGMAFVEFASNESKIAIDEAISSLRADNNTLLAHPLLLNEEGQESAGYTETIIVKSKEGASVANINATLKGLNLGIQTDEKNSDPTLFMVTGRQILSDPLVVCDQLYRTGLFEFVQPNCLRFVVPAATPNDPLFSTNWGLAKMNLPAAWDITTGCSNIKIAIIDDGVQLNHPDLTANLLTGFDATPSGTNGDNVVGEQRHGTNAAGIAAAKGNNSTGVTGVAYNSKIIPIRAYSTNSSGSITTDQYIANAINHAVNVKGADVLNMSWGIISSTVPIYDAIESALNNAATNGRGTKGTVLIAAVGNYGSNYAAPLPGNISSVLMVGASKANDTRWTGSAYPTGQVDVVAPGPNVTTIAGSGYATAAGDNDNRTSWSAPAVAGIAALVLSVNPNLTQSQVRRIIAETADKVGGYTYGVGNGSTYSDLSHNNEMGYGRVNALKALEKAAGAPITGPGLICTNGGYTLTAFPGGSSAVWSSSAGLTMSGNLATRQSGYSGPATITATLTVPNACATIPIKRNIWVGNPNLTKTINGVVAGTTSVVAGNQYNLAASSNSPNTTFNYNNYAGTGDITIDLYSPSSPTTQMYVYSNSTTGYRQVKVTATNTCGNYAEDFVFYLESGLMKAYPNPATDKIKLEFTNSEILEAMPVRVDLYNEKSAIPVQTVNIKEVFEKRQFENGNIVTLDVSSLPRGNYFLHSVAREGSKEIVTKSKVVLE
jgi:hypothetical protein